MKARNLFILCMIAAVLLAGVPVFASGGTEGKAATPQGPVTLKYTVRSNYGGGMVNPSNDLAVYQQYEKLTGIKIDWEIIPTENYDTVMSARLAARSQLPDLMNQGGTRAMDLGADGILIPLEKLIDKVGVNIQKFWGQPDKKIYKVLATTPDDHIWGIPNYVLPSYLTISTQICKPWLDKLGLKEPKTVDEFYNMLVAFRTKDPNGNGNPNDEIPLVPAYASYEQYVATWFGLTDYHMSSSQKYFLGDDGKVATMWTDPRLKEYLTFMNKLWKENLIDKEYGTNNFNTTYEKVSSDRAGVTICWSTFAGTFSGLHPKGEKTGNTPVFIPQMPLVGPRGQANFARRYLVSIGGNVITSACKTPEAAMKYIDFVYASDEALKLQNWGIEGITYKMVDGKFQEIPDPKGGVWGNFLGTAVGGGQPAFNHIQWGWDTRFPKWAVEINNKMQQYFVDPLPTVVQTKEEIAVEKEVGTDLSTYQNEMMNKFIQGQVPLTEFDTFVAQQKKLGLDKLMKNMQQRYDRAKVVLKSMGF